MNYSTRQILKLACLIACLISNSSSAERLLDIRYNGTCAFVLSNSAMSIRLRGGSFLNYIDLSQPNIPFAVENVVAQYLIVQHEMYELRLKKFKDAQLPVMTPANDPYWSRSFYILNTVEPIDFRPPQLHGGIRIVFSHSDNELLPFEEDTGFHRLKGMGAAAEVGRLTKGLMAENGRTDLDTAVDLIVAALNVIASDSTVQNIWVHTSQAHAQLYSSMGLVPTQIYSKDRLNQVLYFTREQLIKYQQPGNVRQYIAR